MRGSGIQGVKTGSLVEYVCGACSVVYLWCVLRWSTRAATRAAAPGVRKKLGKRVWLSWSRRGNNGLHDVLYFSVCLSVKLQDVAVLVAVVSSVVLVQLESWEHLPGCRGGEGAPQRGGT